MLHNIPGFLNQVEQTKSQSSVYNVLLCVCVCVCVRVRIIFIELLVYGTFPKENRRNYQWDLPLGLGWALES